MSGANPVETKAGPAAALNPPAPSPVPKPGRLGRYMKLGVVVAGSALVLAGGWYGFTHFSPTPDRVVAQSDPTPAADTSPPPSKPDEPIKRADPVPDTGLDMKIPAVPVVSSGPEKIDVPKPPDSGFAALPPTPDAPAKPPGKPSSDVPLIDVPSVPDGDKKVKPEADAPPPLLPPDPPGSNLDKAKAADLLKKPAADPFKAPDALPDSDKPKADGRKTGPAPLPGDMTDKIKLDTPPPVIVSGATADPMPPAPPVPTPGKKDDPMGPPPVPKLDIDLPPPPATPDKKKDDVPPLVLPPTPDAPKPGPVNPAAGPDKKKDDVPTLVIPTKPAPAATDPKKDEVPRIEKIDLPNPDPVKAPTVTAEPPAATAPMPTAVAPPADPKKKDMYDED
ncbi:MAG: hypothetical protein J2P46_15740, partial [Zavarzinella sp.]|nr:hypothetical protein [Zavarzinella sp.]